MIVRRLVQLLLVVAAVVIPTDQSSYAQTSAPPNIVYFMADELGYYELSCMGHPYLRTPRIDKMAAEGMRFTQALAGSSVCAPTRCCLMTGKHSGHTSVRSNGGGTPLRAGEETVASLLKRAGYATGGFGKWGCGGRGSTGVPEQHGFDVFFGYYDQVHAHSYYPPYLIRNSLEVPLPGNVGGRTGETYSHHAIMKEALAFIRDHKDQPFFCYLPVTPPHGMFDIPDDDPAWALFADKPWPEEAKRYAAMISMVDRNVGEVLDLLNELQLDEKTLVFFSGDNGGNDYFKSPEHRRGFHGPNVNPRSDSEFRGTKGTLYEGGLRVPLIARWPGKVAPGGVSDLLCYFPDLMPTVAELSGQAAPKDCDGVSLLPELIGARQAGHPQQQHEYLYWELGNQTAVRMKNWKAVLPNARSAWQLFDLASDIGEQHDVSAENPQLLQRLVAYAEAAHEPVEEGTFTDRAAHERDRQAKWGTSGQGPSGRPQKKAGKGRSMNPLASAGLLPLDKMKLVHVSSESRGNGKLAQLAFDGNPATHWHTDFSNGPDRHPHALTLDLGFTASIEGFRYLARQDNGWNGAFKDCEFYVADSADGFGEPAATAQFTKSRESQEVKCEPIVGRYVKIVAKSEVNGGPWASAAEIGIVGTAKPADQDR